MLSSLLVDCEQSGVTVYVWAGHAMPIRGLCFSPDSTLLVTASDDTHIKIYDVYVICHTLLTFLHHLSLLHLTVNAAPGKMCQADYYYNRFMPPLDFVRDYPGEMVTER